MASEKIGNARFAGQQGYLGVQIHSVDALQFHDHVFFLELGQAVGYFHGEFRLGFCSPIWSNCRLSATFQHLRVLRRPTGLIPL